MNVTSVNEASMTCTVKPKEERVVKVVYGGVDNKTASTNNASKKEPSITSQFSQAITDGLNDMYKRSK